MRKKERSGPGIATVGPSGEATLGSSDDEGLEARTNGERDETRRRTEPVAARNRNQDLAQSFADTGVKRSEQDFKISSPSGIEPGRRS